MSLHYTLSKDMPHIRTVNWLGGHNLVKKTEKAQQKVRSGGKQDKTI